MTPAVLQLLDLIDVVLQQCDVLVCRNSTGIRICGYIYHTAAKPQNTTVSFSPQERVEGGALGRGGAVQNAAKRRDNRGLRQADRGDRLVVLPAAAEALVQPDELLALRDLGFGELRLQIVQLPFGVDDVEEVGQPAIIARVCQV